MNLVCAHLGDIHLDEDRYFADTAQCLEWFVADAIRASVDLFVINGDLTTYKATIKERNFWIDRLDYYYRVGKTKRQKSKTKQTAAHRKKS